MGELKISYRVLVGKPERKRRIERQRSKIFDFLECHTALIDIYLGFGKTYRSHLQGSSSPRIT
jgi:hypothetical protein